MAPYSSPQGFHCLLKFINIGLQSNNTLESHKIWAYRDLFSSVIPNLDLVHHLVLMGWHWLSYILVCTWAKHEIWKISNFNNCNGKTWFNVEIVRSSSVLPGECGRGSPGTIKDVYSDFQFGAFTPLGTTLAPTVMVQKVSDRFCFLQHLLALRRCPCKK